MDEPIRHDVHLSVNGVKEKISRYSLSPSLGVLIAGECVVRGVGGERPELHDTLANRSQVNMFIEFCQSFHFFAVMAPYPIVGFDIPRLVEKSRF